MNPQSQHGSGALPGESTVLSVIPKGASFQGILTWRGAVRVEGALDGDAVAHGALEIGPDAHVNGNVLVDELVVAGTLEGDALATRRIELMPGARVVGDLCAPLLVVADGCCLEGRLQMVGSLPGAAPAAVEGPEASRPEDARAGS